MAENQKNTSYHPYLKVPIDSGEDIVISGIAGRYPESDNITQLRDNLMNKVDLITSDDRRWKLDHPEIPQRIGKINHLEKFDAGFFGIHFKQAHTMDAMCRIVMEHACEAIFDAGVNPKDLKGTKTGVYIGACFSETEITWVYQKLEADGLGITGCARTMLANTISRCFELKGPSYTVDSACSSSLMAMEHAYRAIRIGQCDAAIVGGCNLCLHPYVSLQFSRLGVLSPDGCCKAFDANANGYVRSETVSVAFLQKAKDAKRIYATVVHGKINCDGFKEQGITFPSSQIQRELLRDFYQECKVPTTSLEFIEAHGTGTRVGDPEELSAIEAVFCPGRKTPLKIGSVKSNLGHAEPASGMGQISKVIIGFESGVIPPNRNYQSPREGIPALADGRLQVITEPTPWAGGYVGVSSFGFGGANAHILLKSNPKEKVNGGAPRDDLPRLVMVSGRTKEAVDSILTDVESRPVDVDYVRLLHELHKENITGHHYRGYTIVNTLSKTKLREIEYYPELKRPVWFIFSGIGSEWPKMGSSLLCFPIFADAIRKCDAALRPHRVEVYNIIQNPNKSIFENTINTLVGITAVQIGLVDLLKSLQIAPDAIIGHSIGELACAYVDGCLTVEQVILAAYYTGLALTQTKKVKGLMATVDIGYDKLKNVCPSDIDIAWQNGPNSSTISGPAESVHAFVTTLTANKITTQDVSCNNIAYHSRYVVEAGSRLVTYLKQIIPEAKPRSTKWFSTSVPKCQWNSSVAQLFSAEYYTNNLLSPVFFAESSAFIPKDAVTIEIAPHGLLQNILKKTLNGGITNIALTQRGHKNNTEVFLQSIGKLYEVGLQPTVWKLYPEVKFPVSRGTPMISPLIKWDHSEDWYVTSYRLRDKISTGERTIELALTDEDYEYMGGHIIDGRNLLPATGYLQLIWETLGMMRGELYTEVPVVFEDVKFLRATTVSKEVTLQITLMIQKGTGRFEVIEGGAAIVTGRVRHTPDPQKEQIKFQHTSEDEPEEMNSRDFYKELRLRGYQYSGYFKAIKSASIDGSKGTIYWHNNWVAFMDNMLQLKILGLDTRKLLVPTGIQKLTIDTKKHLQQLREMPHDSKEFKIYTNKEHDVISSGGVEIRGLKANAIARKKPAGEPVLENYYFVAHRDRAEVNLQDAVHQTVHLSLENHLGIKVKTLEFLEAGEKYPHEELISPIIADTLADLPMIQADVNVVASENPFEAEITPQDINVIESKKLTADTNALILAGRNLLVPEKTGTLAHLLSALKDGAFVITIESLSVQEIALSAKKHNLHVIFEKVMNHASFLLLKKIEKIPRQAIIVQVNNEEFTWLNRLKAALKAEVEHEIAGSSRILIVSDKNFENGLLGLVNCLRREPGGETVRGVLIQDENAPNFSLSQSLYADQLKLDLAINVLRPNGIWGSYRHHHLSPLKPRSVYHGWANQLVKGDLTSFQWMEGPITPNCNNEDLVRVVYSSINFRDIMLATGKLTMTAARESRAESECVLGFEYVGVKKDGRRVMGMGSRAMANTLIYDPLLAWTVPDSWSLEDAATVPCVYGTSYYALSVHGRMQRGDKVLIHAGSGGVGQAVITLALWAGCEVFTTVGTQEKRAFIRQKFPQIPEDHIGNSRDTSFEQMVMQQTKGKGINIVLNSLADDKLQASVRCLAERGRFLEIGKFDMVNDNPLALSVFTKEISFHGVLLDKVFDAPANKKKELQSIMQKGLDEGAIKPLNATVFPRDQIEPAFRYMAAGKHIGKVILQIQNENNLEAWIPAFPRYHCLKNHSYLILGGLGGFGLELCDWLVLRGAQHLFLTSRFGIKNGYQKMRIRLWQSYGTKVTIIVGKDASNLKDCEEILSIASKETPIDAIYNLAVVLNDSLWENQTPETFEESFKVKAWTTKNLDKLSRSMCPGLRHFVVFSSVSCGRGNAGQTNYGMSNSVMERICEKRATEGLPALAIQWGAVGDVGLVADMHDDNKELIIGGTLQQKITSCLHELDGFLNQNSSVVASMVVAEKRAGGSGDLNIIETVLNIMGLKDLKSVSHHTSLAELGMDSMMAVEIKQTLEREFEVFLTAQDIRGLNFAKLIEMNAKDSDPKEETVKVTKQEEVPVGIKLLVKLVGEENTKEEICLKLSTKEEPGRQEVFLIPGIEGFASIFSKLAEKVKAPATCLQLDSKNTKYMSIQEMADQLLSHILKRSQGSKNFVIAGYSFGSLIAIELVRKLEAQGFTGRLVLIDGSPELMKAMKTQQLASENNDELETSILVGMIDAFAPEVSGELFIELKKLKSWEEKLDLFMERLPPNMPTLSSEYRKNVCTCIYKRLLAIDNYDISKASPLKTPIILMRPIVDIYKGLTADYGLNQVTTAKVAVYTLDENHTTIIDNPKVATAINGEPLENLEISKTSIIEGGKFLNYITKPNRGKSYG